MIRLIENIVEQNSNLDSSRFEFEKMDFYIVSYKNRNDFFLFISTTEDELKSWVKKEDSDIEFLLNSLTLRLRVGEKAPLKEFEKRFIEKNLSLILLVDIKESKKEPTWLLRCEENHMQSKKYVLCHQQEHLEELEDKLKEFNDVSIQESFDNLIRDNSSQISSGHCEDWFVLLTRIYSKIPFVNYSIDDDNKKELESLSQNINQNLSEKNLIETFDKILRYHKDDDVYEFILKEEIE